MFEEARHQFSVFPFWRHIKRRTHEQRQAPFLLKISIDPGVGRLIRRTPLLPMKFRISQQRLDRFRLKQWGGVETRIIFHFLIDDEPTRKRQELRRKQAASPVPDLAGRGQWQTTLAIFTSQHVSDAAISVVSWTNPSLGPARSYLLFVYGGILPALAGREHERS